MALFNDAYDAADIMMTRKEKGPKAAEIKKKEIETKQKKVKERVDDTSSN